MAWFVGLFVVVWGEFVIVGGFICICCLGALFADLLLWDRCCVWCLWLRLLGLVGALVG